MIAAYARMEGYSDGTGCDEAERDAARVPAADPARLTGRADAVRRLTSLFEQAKFSRREIDASMKQDAIGALREIRDDMEATA